MSLSLRSSSIRARAMAIAFTVLPATLVAQPGRDTLASRTTLPAQVITATREPTALRTQPSTVSVLDGAELRAAGVTHLGDALRLVPGIAVMRPSSYGSQTSLFLRGGQANYVRVLIDGVPLNEPGGTLDLGRITLDDVERIEVVRGPASVLYGSEAVSGVIQLFTRRAAARSRVDAEIETGTYDSRHAGLGGAAQALGLEWSVRGDHHASDGILAFNNAYRNDGLVATVAVPPSGRRSDARLTARYNASQYQYPTGSDGTVEDRNAERTEHRLSVGLDAGHRWSDRAESRMQLTFSELHPRTSDGPDDASDVNGFYGYFARATVVRHVADLRTSFALPARQRVAVGTEFARDAERGSSLTLSEFGDTPDEFRATRENVAGYAQLLGDVGRWTYTLGARLDDNSAFGTFRTARVAVGYRITERLTGRLSGGSAFKAPSFFENFAQGFTLGNPALRPEQARSGEVGLEARLRGGVLFRTTAFAQRFTNLIQYTGTPPAPGEPNYYNIAAANAGGLEFEIAVERIAGVGASAAYTWTDTRVIDAGFSTSPNDNFVTGGRLLRRPEHLATVHLVRTLGTVGTAQLTLAHVGRREDRDFSTFPAGIVFLDAYETVDLAVEFGLPAGLVRDARLSLRSENLGGARYEAVYGFETPGRTIHLGLRLQR